jgi:hypothetical protein
LIANMTGYQFKILRKYSQSSSEVQNLPTLPPPEPVRRGGHATGDGRSSALSALRRGRSPAAGSHGTGRQRMVTSRTRRRCIRRRARDQSACNGGRSSNGSTVLGAQRCYSEGGWPAWKNEAGFDSAFPRLFHLCHDGYIISA